MIAALLHVAFLGAAAQAPYANREGRPRIFIEDDRAVARRCEGPLAEDYRVVKERADPAEKFRRDRGNENDGGLLRHVYREGPWPRERGRITAYGHDPRSHTYAAADLTPAYSAHKVREVTRQFLYLRGAREFFVIFDRIEATRAEFARHGFLHVPTEPSLEGRRASWLSLPEADGDRTVLSRGRSRAFLHTLLPENAAVVRRGGRGQEAWGHPLEPAAQYNHEAPGRLKPPICPWRIEVGDPGAGMRTLFLHVLELADEEVRTPSRVDFVPPAGVDLEDGRRVRFHAEGPLGGTLDGQPLPTAPRIDAQYPPPGFRGR
jgi:hypothetical protein